MYRNSYATHRKKIKSGDLLVWNKGTGGFVSNILMFIIKVFTLSEYVHVGIAWRISSRLFVIEATSSGVKITPLSHRREFFHLPLGIKWVKAYDSFLLDKVGQSYSYVDAVRGYFGLFINEQDNKWQCVELASAFYKVVGLDLPDAFTPAKLVSALMESGTSIYYINERRHGDRSRSRTATPPPEKE